MRIQVSDQLDKDEIQENIKSAKIVDDGDFILLPKNRKHSVYDKDGITFINLEDIDYIESLENDIIVHVDNKDFISMIRLYEYLDCASYLIRISKSIVVNKHKISEIKPSINMKFKILVNKTYLEVNRTYYYDFKDEFGI